MAENDQSEQINRLLAQLRKEEGAAISEGEMGAMMSKGVPMSQGDPTMQRQMQNYTESLALGEKNALGPYTREELNEAAAPQALRKATRREPGAAVSNSEMQQFMNEELNLITTAQEGLMQLDPEGTRDVVQGLEVSKNKVMSGAALSPDEYTGISAILEQIANAFKGMMGGGESTTKTYMVDGRPVEMTEREVMGAKNAGILVQDPESAIRDMEMQK